MSTYYTPILFLGIKLEDFGKETLRCQTIEVPRYSSVTGEFEGTEKQVHRIIKIAQQEFDCGDEWEFDLSKLQATLTPYNLTAVWLDTVYIGVNITKQKKRTYKEYGNCYIPSGIPIYGIDLKNKMIWVHKQLTKLFKLKGFTGKNIKLYTLLDIH